MAVEYFSEFILIEAKDLFDDDSEYKFVNIIGVVKLDRDSIVFQSIKIARGERMMISPLHIMIAVCLILSLIGCLCYFACKYRKVKKILKEEVREIEGQGVEMNEVPKKYGKFREADDENDFH